MVDAESKNLSSLVEDIGKVLQGPTEVSDEMIGKLGNEIAAIVAQRLTATTRTRTHLSLSSIGKPLRKLWYDMKEPTEEKLEPSTLLKFMYGDIIEALLLWLAEVSGHAVSQCQAEVTHHGIVGHIDSVIDGEVVDVKSASDRAFMKFVKGNLPEDDPFGYLAQIQAYDEEIGNGNPAFLVMNKVTGGLCLYQPDKDFDLPDTKMLIDSCKEALSMETPPVSKCYQDVEDGKSGNRVLDKGCTYCPHKYKCWEGLRTFQYSNGPKYFTTVNKLPNVKEITNDY